MGSQITKKLLLFCNSFETKNELMLQGKYLDIIRET